MSAISIDLCHFTTENQSAERSWTSYCKALTFHCLWILRFCEDIYVHIFYIHDFESSQTVQ